MAICGLSIKAKNSSTKAFTLIELSIVLVIIGLVTGGILVGKSLMASARNQQTIKELNGYLSAVGLFQAQYNGLPGDIVNATTFFGTTDVNGNTVVNGNGDLLTGWVQWCQTGESLTAWQMLGLSKYINGIYSGVQDNTTPIGCHLQVNVPGSQYAPYATWGFGSGAPNNWFTNNLQSFLILTSWQQNLNVAQGGIGVTVNRGVMGPT